MLKKILKNEREKRNLSQKELSQIINVSQQTIGSWETGRTEPNSEALHQLADFFNISVDYLLGRSTSKHNILPESEQTIDQHLEEVLEQLAGEGKSLMFKGQPMSEQTKEALLMSLKNTLALAEKMAEMEKKNSNNLLR